MRFLAFAILALGLAAGSTGCCCLGGGCSPCSSCYSGCGPTYGYAPSGCSSCGGCPNGNCGVPGAMPGAVPGGVYPQGAYYGPTDYATASVPQPFGPFGYPQTAMAPLESLPTY